jgi:hypothetical protein
MVGASAGHAALRAASLAQEYDSRTRPKITRSQTFSRSIKGIPGFRVPNMRYYFKPTSADY